MICHDILRIPVKPPFNCSCPVRCCFHCTVEYLMLHLPQESRYRQYTEDSVKCLLCDSRIDVQDCEENILEIDFFLMHVIDAIYVNKTLKCPYCSEDGFLTQSDLHRHVKGNCTKAFIQCSWCYEPIKRETLEEHLCSCSKAEKCPWCNKKIIFRHHKMTHKIRCSKRRLRCVVCETIFPLEELGTHLQTHNNEIQESLNHVYS
jgi:hypothetical protein